MVSLFPCSSYFNRFAGDSGKDPLCGIPFNVDTIGWGARSAFSYRPEIFPQIVPRQAAFIAVQAGGEMTIHEIDDGNGASPGIRAPVGNAAGDEEGVVLTVSEDQS